MKKDQGFTLVELLICIVIIGILLAIALPNLKAAQTRAKMVSVRSNMKTLQTMVESYGVDWGGVYPGNVAQLTSEAQKGNYWKSFPNPYTGKNESPVDTTMISDPEDVTAGMTVYFGSQCFPIEDLVPPANATSYIIYGLIDGNHGEVDLIRSKGNEVFYLANS